MKQFLLDLFAEQSTVSMMRMMSLISLLIGGALAAYGIYTGKDLSALSILVGVFVGAAFGGKTAQKYIENKKD